MYRNLSTNGTLQKMGFATDINTMDAELYVRRKEEVIIMKSNQSPTVKKVKF